MLTYKEMKEDLKAIEGGKTALYKKGDFTHRCLQSIDAMGQIIKDLVDKKEGAEEAAAEFMAKYESE